MYSLLHQLLSDKRAARFLPVLDHGISYIWFFVVRDPFYLLPASIAPYLMPFVMVLVMFTAVTLIYGASQVIRKLVRQ